MFDKLVDLTEPICQRIDANKAAMALFNTSGIEVWITENNPKYSHRIIKQLKAFKKQITLMIPMTLKSCLWCSMPPRTTANPAIQQLYINGHFCYTFKFGIIPNGLDIVRDITFYNKKFLEAHPDIIIEKKYDSSDEDKSLADSKALIPIFKDFFKNIR